MFTSTSEFEELMPDLAQSSAKEREFFHGGALNDVLERTADYAADEVKREDMNREVGYEAPTMEEEISRRETAVRTAQLLARQIEAARARGALREELLADAFGVAHWSIAVPIGFEPRPERLALIPDERLRFVIAFAIPGIAMA